MLLQKILLQNFSFLAVTFFVAAFFVKKMNTNDTHMVLFML